VSLAFCTVISTKTKLLSQLTHLLSDPSENPAECSSRAQLKIWAVGDAKGLAMHEVRFELTTLAGAHYFNHETRLFLKGAGLTTFLFVHYCAR